MSDELEQVRQLCPDVEVDPNFLALQRSYLMEFIEQAAPDPGPDTLRIVPHLAYEDPAAAIEWLERAFGFVEREGARITTPDSIHSTMDTGAGGIMIGAPGGHGAFSPRTLGGPSLLLTVYITDVDAHCERARAAGAVIVAEPEDKFFGARTYEVLDLEGHRWAFHQQTGRRWDFSPSDDE